MDIQISNFVWNYCFKYYNFYYKGFFLFFYLSKNLMKNKLNRLYFLNEIFLINFFEIDLVISDNFK